MVQKAMTTEEDTEKKGEFSVVCADDSPIGLGEVPITGIAEVSEAKRPPDRQECHEEVTAKTPPVVARHDDAVALAFVDSPALNLGVVHPLLELVVGDVTHRSTSSWLPIHV